MKRLKTEWGKGKRLYLNGIAENENKYKIEKELVVELYNNFPDAAISYAMYKNTGDKEFIIDADYSTVFRWMLTCDKESQPCDFWSFQGHL